MEPFDITVTIPAGVPEVAHDLVLQGLRLKSFQFDNRDVTRTTEPTGGTTLTIPVTNETHLSPPPDDDA
jgi:hypothetical protein